MPAADIFKPDSILIPPKNSFLAAYESSEGAARTLCTLRDECYSFNVSYAREVAGESRDGGQGEFGQDGFEV